MGIWDSVIFEPVFGWPATVVLALLLLLSLWLTATAPGISRRGRSVLLLLRILAVWLLWLAWLRPGFMWTSERETAGAVAVLVDTSQSMALPSGQSDQTRWDEVRRVWESIRTATDLQIGASQIVPYTFDSQARRVPHDDLPELSETLAGPPRGRATDLGGALSAVLQGQTDPPLRAILLVTDGVETVTSPTADATVVARQMAQLDQPLILVGLGPQADASQLRDVAIESLPEHYTAFVKKELPLRFILAAQGVQNQPVDIQLRLRRGNQEPRVVASREVLVAGAKEKQPLEFSVLMPEPGEYLLDVVASVEAVEQIKSNNRATCFITVREGGARILYLEGEPRPEQLFLKRSLNESLDFDVDYVLFPQRDRRAGKWPIRMAAQVPIEQYDAFVIGDLDSSAIDSTSWQQIADRVRRGAGLMATGGYHSFDAGGYGLSPLAPLFPIELSRRRQPFDQPIDPSFHLPGPVRLVPRRPHPITAFAPEPRNSQIWRSLKPLQGMNRLGRVLPNPGVQVLLESEKEEPALVAGTFGEGRVLAFAADTTWQWWLAGNKKEHQQFWRQAMLWLIQRDAVDEGFRLTLARRRWKIDDTPRLTIEWFGGAENKPMPQQMRLSLLRDGKLQHTLGVTSVGEGKLESRITGLNTVGLYQVELEATGADGTKYHAETAFLVEDTLLELERVVPDWPYMANLAAANQGAGGRLVTPDQVDEVLQWLEARQAETKVSVVEKRKLGDSAVDGWFLLTLFCMVMTIEWGLRKRWQLP
ncbi:MAG: membrane protein [Pirellulaceae bacterium]|nr:MAG: membrane protein [Pirellulaceae bacterium]